MNGDITVSVVIPTRNRPELLLRSVRSALSQTVSNIEVIVVIDGPDEATVQALQELNDPRLVTVGLPQSVGGSDARNTGAQKARGQFVAFLDDDDEWVEDKLAKQIRVATESKQPLPVVTSRLIARRDGEDEVWPTRPMGSDEPMAEYLLCRENSIRQGEGFIQTSTLLMTRELILQVPFRSGLPRHQDWDWLIRASAFPGVFFCCVWEPLTIYHIDTSRKSISSGSGADPSIQWISQNRLVSTKAQAYFYATQVAVRCHSFAIFRGIVANTFRYPRAFAIAMGLTLVPRTLGQRLFKSRNVNRA